MKWRPLFNADFDASQTTDMCTIKTFAGIIPQKLKQFPNASMNSKSFKK